MAKQPPLKLTTRGQLVADSLCIVFIIIGVISFTLIGKMLGAN